MKENIRKVFQTVMVECAQCGLCTEACGRLQGQEESPGAIAGGLMNSRTPEQLMDFVLKCSLCGLCREICPQMVDIPLLVRRARQNFFESGVGDAGAYQAMWVDHDWNAFSLYRHSYGLDAFYDDLAKATCDTIFFPGCMLANEGPEIVKAAIDWLGDGNKTVSVSVDCCGAPLRLIGLRERWLAYSDNLWRSIAASGAKQVVTACPTCHARLAALGENCGIEVISIFKLMAEAGLSAPLQGDGKVTVHDSCTDRHGSIGQYVRQMLSDYEIKEMKHHGANTICCGSGGIVSFVDPHLCEERADKRLKELAASGASMVVTYCMSCAHRLHGRSEHEVRHMLELILDKRIDHDEFNAMAGAIWQGDAGEENFVHLQTSIVKAFSGCRNRECRSDTCGHSGPEVSGEVR